MLRLKIYSVCAALAHETCQLVGAVRQCTCGFDKPKSDLRHNPCDPGAQTFKKVSYLRREHVYSHARDRELLPNSSIGGIKVRVSSVWCVSVTRWGSHAGPRRSVFQLASLFVHLPGAKAKMLESIVESM